MESMAFDIKSEREKRKISLSQIAAETRISLRYLQAIEEGRFSDLPGGMYNRAFIKAYCETINLDPQQILEQYEAQLSTTNTDRTPRSGMPVSGRNTFSIPGPVIIWSILLLISALGIYFSRGWISDLFSPYFSGRTENISVSIPDVEQPNPPPSPSDKSEQPENSSFHSDTSQNLSETYQATPAPSQMDGTKQESPPVENSTTASNLSVISKSGSAKLRLLIIANQQCWISIEKDGIPYTKKLMKPGEEQFVQAEEQLNLLIGNAGGITMNLNDRQMKPVGEPGEVVRLDINVHNLEQFISQTPG